MSPSKDPVQLKQAFVDKLGEAQWDETWDSIAKLSPELFEASVDLIAVPRSKKHLSPKVQQLISIAVDASSTHLFVPGVKTHIDAALREGATAAEIIEVIELTGTLGIHACNIGVPLLVEVMKEEGIYEQHATAGKPFDAHREKLKAEFTKNRGYWHTFWEDFLALDPEFFEAYLKFSSVPWLKDVDGSGKGGGALEPKVCLWSTAFPFTVLDTLTIWHPGQRVGLLCIRCRRHPPLCPGLEVTHEECTELWRDPGGDYGSPRDCHAAQSTHVQRGSTHTGPTTWKGVTDRRAESSSQPRIYTDAHSTQ